MSKSWSFFDGRRMTPKWKLVFRLNEILILVIRGEKKNIWFLRFSFGVIWKCAFRLNETLIFDIRMSKKNGKFSVFFWSLYNVNNLRTASFSLNATRCRSKSLNSACFHTWRCVSTYRSTPIWTSLDSPHPTPPPCNVQTCKQRGQRSSTCATQVHMDVA